VVGPGEQPQGAGGGGQWLQVGDELDRLDARAGVVVEAGLTEVEDALGIEGQDGRPDELAGDGQESRVLDQGQAAGVLSRLIIGR
jgi:hypothetical protein